MNTELIHYGVLGMRWGVRKDNKSKKISYGSRKLKKISNEELQTRISRLKLEKEYTDLLKSTKKMSFGKKVLTNTLDRVGNDVAQQFTKYWVGTAINTAFDAKIINTGESNKKDKDAD